jgi:hypothetical protein
LGRNFRSKKFCSIPATDKHARMNERGKKIEQQEGQEEKGGEGRRKEK